MVVHLSYDLAKHGISPLSPLYLSLLFSPSLSLRLFTHQMYMTHMSTPYQAVMRKCHMSGIGFGVGQAMTHFMFAALFYYAAYLIEERVNTFDEVYLYVFPH